MGFLSGIEIRRRIERGELKIHSLDSEEPFSIDNQVTEDAVDLRLAPAGLVLRDDVTEIDYVNDNVDGLYDVVEIPAGGYLLEPNKILLTQSLEAVCLPDDVMGLILTRSSFARLGLLVTCFAPKSPPGIRWAIPLQLVNVSRVPFRIHPFTSVAQLIMSKMVGEPIGYRGKYQDSFTIAAPIFSSREMESIGALNSRQILRTFHIIARDALLRNSPPPGDAPAAEPELDRREPLGDTTPAFRPRRRFAKFVVISLSTIAAIGYGIAGNIISGGKIDYWQGVSLVLLILLSSIFTAAALVLRATDDRGGS